MLRRLRRRPRQYHHLPLLSRRSRTDAQDADLLAVLGLGLASLFTAISTAPAQTDTKGKVSLESKSVAVGIGVSWGDGILDYRGKKYPFTIDGLSGLDLGVAKVTATGVVANLKKLDDFNGNYVFTAAGASAGGGVGRGRAEEPKRRRDGVDRNRTGGSSSPLRMVG